MKFPILKPSASLLFIALLGLSSCQAQQDSAPGLKNVDAEGFRESLKSGNAVLVDVRTPEEFREGHIEGARSIDIHGPEFRERLSTLDTTATVHVYCRSGNRSGRAVGIMKELGFSDIVHLQKGILSWQEAGLPLVKGEKD